MREARLTRRRTGSRDHRQLTIMPELLLLTSLPTIPDGDTAELVAPAFRARGWRVHCRCIDALRLDAAGPVIVDRAAPVRPAAMDMIWVLGFGRREGFLDKMQLLQTLSPQVRFVNRIEALLTLHGKYPAAATDDRLPQPLTFAAADPDFLIDCGRAEGGRWVLKPPGGSFGRDVHLLDAESPDFAPTIHRLAANGWWLLQRYCPEVEAGEHRVLVASGRIIGSYRREPTIGPSNLAGGGRATRAGADPERDRLARSAAAFLLARGIAWAGLDLAGPWVLEANIINPGGLDTLRQLGAGNLAPDVVSALLE